MNPIEVARNLFLLRREHSMTAEELADALEVTPELVCEWECAKTSPTLEQINRLAKVYGVSVSDIIVSPKTSHLPESEFPKPAPVKKETTPKTQTPVDEEPIPPRKSSQAWEIVVIILLLLIIAASVTFLIKPEWFPLKSLFGAWVNLMLPRLL